MTQIQPIFGGATDILAGRPPTQIPAFMRRYQDPSVSALPPALMNPLMQLDYNRAIRGQNLISQDQLPYILQSMMTGEPSAATAREEGKKSLTSKLLEWPGKVGKDLAAMGMSLPHIPQMLVGEAKALPGAPEEIQQALAKGDFGRVLRAPGIRLIPGTYALQGPKAFAEHPLFAALDVAPAIGAAMKVEGVQSRMASVASKIGESDVAEYVKNLGPVRGYRQAMGPEARETSRIAVHAGRRIQTGMIAFGRELNAMQKEFGLSDQRVEELTKIGTTDPHAIATLPGNEQAYLGRVRQMANDQFQRWADEGLAGQFDNEYYPISDYNRLQNLHDRYSEALEAGDRQTAASIKRKFDDTYEMTPPLRYYPLLRRQFSEQLTTLARSRVPAEAAQAWGEVQRNIQDSFWNEVAPVVAKDEMQNLQEYVTPHWVNMKEQGLDPILLHTVTQPEAARLMHPTVYPATEYTPRTINEGVWNPSPGIQNFQVGLGYGELEYLRKTITSEAIDEMMNTFGKPRDEVERLYVDRARHVAERSHDTARHHLDQLVNRDWVEWHPETVFPWRRARGAGIRETEPMMVPKSMQKAVDDLYKAQQGELRKSFDKSMKVFKTSVLAMSPRWHLYNLIGGAAMLAGKTGPSVMRFLREAHEMAKAEELPTTLSRGFMDIPSEAQIWNSNVGRKIGAMAREREGLLTKWESLSDKTIGRVYKYQSHIDDMYRSMAYLYGKDKALKKGLTVVEAEERGAKLANKVLQDWDSMTPFERNVIRSAVPFYGWMRHILNYVMKYPWDHPLRAGIVASFARNEIKDWKNGLPQQWQNYFFFGGPDRFGNEKGFRVGGANPFGDVANYFTLGGLLSSLNPIAGGVLDAMGVNPITGKADLYPELHYNEETGRLEPKTKPVWQGVGEALLPPLPLLRHLTGIRTADEKRMQMTDPQAYRSMVMSAAGIPFVPRTVNKALETGRAELRRQQEMREVLKNAMRSGDYGEAMKYPALRQIIGALQQMDQQGLLDEYRIGTPPAGVVGSDAILQRLATRGQR